MISTFRAMAQQLGIPPHPAYVVLVFFAYSFAGYVMECIVLSIEHKRLVLNRGFTGHLPFCIIYGFGALAGYALLCPLADNLPVLFFAGAVGATCFEYLTARLQTRLFGDFWWDYNKKPFNYKGMLCLESTVGWGLLALLVVKILHKELVGLVALIPSAFAAPLAAVLLCSYALDFVLSARTAAREKRSTRQDAEVSVVSRLSQSEAERPEATQKSQ